MNEPAVVFDSVWKKFRRGERHDSLRDLIPGTVKGWFRRTSPSVLDAQEFWALQNVSFSLEPGEALGIIGANGAGKSTVLKLLTGVLGPTSGRSVLHGRVGALIEIAAGFHGDLTGRENIFLQGAIMGMKQANIARKLDEIVEFAGVGDFIDTPVKRFSSGMNARLGFSIASHLDPDILIIDEVLSVGDMAFQQKCLNRMSQFLDAGVALVFVSHNLQAVARLCPSALLLDRGVVQALGPSDEVIRSYVATSQRQAAEDPDGAVGIVSARLTAVDGQVPLSVAPGTPLTLRLEVLARRSLGDLLFSVLVRRAGDNLIVYNISIPGSTLGITAFSAGQRATIDYNFRVQLTRGVYVIECRIIHAPTRRDESVLAPAAFITVDEDRTNAGVADLALVGRAFLHDSVAQSATLSEK